MKSLMNCLLALGLGCCRVVVGLVVIRAGYDLTRNQGSFVYWNTDSAIAGIFVIVLGLCFIVLGIFPKLFNKLA